MVEYARYLLPRWQMRSGGIFKATYVICSLNVIAPLGPMWYDEVPGSCRSDFVVSVACLPMFVEAFYSSANQCSFRGGLELAADSSLLMANRDGFTATVREQFSKVVGGLVQNQSAVRYGQVLDLSINFDGCGTNVAKPDLGGPVAGVEPIRPRASLELPRLVHGGLFQC